MSRSASFILFFLYSLAIGFLPVSPTMAAGSAIANQTDPSAAAQVERRRTSAAISRRISLGGSPHLGNPDARIGIVEFSDYQCPACRGFHLQLFPALKAKYVDTGIVQLIHKDLPLEMHHEQALSAAQAANCAWAQNRFWEMNHALYLNQNRLGTDLYLEQARRLKLDEEFFSYCMDNPASLKGVVFDTAVALQLGINATPSFVIGVITGDTLEVTSMSQGMPNFNVFADEIEKLHVSLFPERSAPSN